MSIRKRCEAATPGPWTAVGNSWEVTTIYRPSGTGAHIDAVAECHHEAPEDDEAAQSNHDNNAEFIAHSRTDIPVLLAAGDKLRDAAKLNYQYQTNGLVSRGPRQVAEEALAEAIENWNKVTNV